MKQMKTIVVLLGVFLSAVSANSQQQRKQPIEVQCLNTSHDSIGADSCSALLEEIAKTAHYEMASTGTRWRLHISTTGDVLHPNGISSQAIALTIVVNYKEVFISLYSSQSRADTVKGEAWMLMNRAGAEIQARTYTGDKKCALGLTPDPDYSSGCPFDLRDSRTDQP